MQVRRSHERVGDGRKTVDRRLVRVREQVRLCRFVAVVHTVGIVENG